MIGQKLKTLRTKKGYSQRVLADRAGVSLRTVQRVENEETSPHGDTLRKLTAALGVPPDALIDWQKNEDTTYLAFTSGSALSFILFPLLGVLVPLVLWLVRRDTIQHLDKLGKEIVKFEVIWNLIFFGGGVYMYYRLFERTMITSLANSNTFLDNFIHFQWFTLIMFGINAAFILVTTICVAKGYSPWWRR